MERPARTTPRTHPQRQTSGQMETATAMRSEWKLKFEMQDTAAADSRRHGPAAGKTRTKEESRRRRKRKHEAGVACQRGAAAGAASKAEAVSRSRRQPVSSAPLTPAPRPQSAASSSVAVSRRLADYRHARVLIVGAGPAALAAACQLSDEGYYDVVMLEARDRMRRASAHNRHSNNWRSNG